MHCLELKTRKWKKSLRVDGITYIWELALGTDGMIYGGTYPGCVLLQYNPDTHKLINLGHISNNDKNLYSRNVFTNIPGKVYANCGMDSNCIGMYDIETKTISQVMSGYNILKATGEHLYISNGEKSLLVDGLTLKPIEKESSKKGIKSNPNSRQIDRASFVFKLENGDRIGVSAQQYLVLKKEADKPEYKQIPSNPPPVEIFSLTSDDDGIVWGTTALGQTMFSYNPKIKTYWNSNTITRAGGEAYGIVCQKEKIYMTAYAGGDHIVYSPNEEWQQRENINPITLKKIGPEYIRPKARSIVGPDNNIWTGWIAKYGTYGCAITEINIETYEVRMFKDLAPNQGIGSITGDHDAVYFTTSGSGNGLKTKKEEFSLVKLRKDGTITKKIKFPVGVYLSALIRTKDKLVLFSRFEQNENRMHVYDHKTFIEENTSVLEYNIHRVLRVKDRDLLIYASCIKNEDSNQSAYVFLVMDEKNYQIKSVLELKSECGAYCYNDVDGYIYLGHGNKLYRIKYSKI